MRISIPFPSLSGLEIEGCVQRVEVDAEIPVGSMRTAQLRQQLEEVNFRLRLSVFLHQERHLDEITRFTGSAKGPRRVLGVRNVAGVRKTTLPRINTMKAKRVIVS